MTNNTETPHHHKKILVLPEQGLDERVAQAAQIIQDSGAADILDTKDLNQAQLDTCKEKLATLNKYSNCNEDEINTLIKEPQILGALCLKTGIADCCIVGATCSTAEVLRAGLHIVGLKPGVVTASSCFLMKTPNNGELIFADCAVNISPDAETLAQIAIDSACTANSLGINPRVAMLSASTKGSARYDAADKVIQATRIIKEKKPTLIVDGEVQADTALVPSVAQKKGADTFAKAPANVLVFPDLDSSNTSYKLVERLSDTKAIGPILQGFAQPINDLSRGCSVDDIVDLAKVTVRLL